MIRIYLTPYSTGSDIPQFLGFADTMLRHGLKFYEYASTSSSINERWPYPWPYIYGPIWAIILSFLRYYLAPRAYVYSYWIGQVYYVKVSIDWIIVVKSILIIADVINFILIYLISRKLTDNKKYWILAPSIYFLHPMVIYITGIYGMFDQLALSPFLFSIYIVLCSRGNSDKMFASGIFTGLSILIKHVILAPLPLIAIYIAKHYSIKKSLAWFLGIVISVLAVFTPFLASIEGNINEILKLFTYPLSTYYVEPICYSFNGLSSLISYLYKHYGIELGYLLKLWWIPFTSLLSFLVILSIKRHIDLIYLITVAYTISITTYWRINHQYFVALIAFLSLTSTYFLEKEKLCETKLSRIHLLNTLNIALIAIIGFWVFMYPISFWFHVHIENPNWKLIEIINRFSLMVFEEKYYVIYSLVLTLTEYFYIFLSLLLYRALRENAT